MRSKCCRLLVLSALVVGFSSLAVCARPQAVRIDEKAKLEKRRSELADQIKKEEEKLWKKRDELAAEYQRLQDTAVVGRIIPAVQKAADQLKDGFAGDKYPETKAALLKELRAILAEHVGPAIGGLIQDDLTTNIADRIKEGQTLNAEIVVRLTIEDEFEGQAFDAAFDAVIKPGLSKNLKRLQEELAGVERQIDDLNKVELAKRSGIPPGMVAVKGGGYRIGIDDADLRTLANDLGYGKNPETMVIQWRSTPAHEVNVEDFYIDENEVTCAWYAAFLKENPDTAAKRTPKYWKEGKFPNGFENRPVTGISYRDAEACARWMGRRIPTEIEWEAAARFAADPRKDPRWYPWGPNWDGQRCNNDAATNHPLRSSLAPGLPAMLPVGTFPNGKSQLGLNDLAGNAYEMTSSPFVPYKGFKEVNINGRRVSSADFVEDHITLRGGDALKRDVVVTTFSRLSMHPDARSDLVGFRTVASQLRGKDRIFYLKEDGDLASWVVAYHPLPSDTMSSRKGGALAIDTPSGYTSVTNGGWDFETNLPTRAIGITAISRACDDFRDMNTLRTLAEDAKDKTVMLGFIELDVPSVDPKLDPGAYFVLYHGKHLEDEEGKTVETAPAGKPDGGKPRKPAKAATSGKQKTVPEAIVFQRRGGEEFRLRVEKFLPPVVSTAMPTRINLNVGEADAVEVVFSYPVKFQAAKSFTFPVRLKLAEGTASKLR